METKDFYRSSSEENQQPGEPTEQQNKDEPKKVGPTLVSIVGDLTQKVFYNT